jgi:hypothetical protein
MNTDKIDPILIRVYPCSSVAKFFLASALFFPQFLRDLLHFPPNSQQIAAPKLPDLFLRVPPPHQFQRDIERFRRAIPAVDSAAPSKSDEMPT